MESCTLCPRRCGARRDAETGRGFCRLPETMRIARLAPHLWEEPPISGSRGTGAVFFSGCTLRCVYCQNGEISHRNAGRPFTPRELSDTLKRLTDLGMHTLSFITGTPFIPQILDALELWRPPLPLVWNTSGYERAETLKALEGKVDIYLPDLKYADNRLAKALSGAPDYFPVATRAIREMFRQVGPAKWQGEKLVSGVVIRHLILPGQVENSLKVLDWIGENFAPGQVLVSLMRQYTPIGGLPAPFDRQITDEEYDSVLSWMYLNDLEGFTQEAEAADQAFIPDF